MKLKTKLWLLVAGIVVVIMGLDFTLGFRGIESAIEKKLEQDAADIRGLLMSMRKVYQQEFIASEISVTPKTIGLLPAHAFSRISREFDQWSRSGLRFNNVSDRPRNPRNRANTEEMAAMDWFRNNPKAPERMVELRREGGLAAEYHFSAPIWVEPHCLKCHGRREDAPMQMGDNSTDPAFGYHPGELRGLISIHLPTERLRAAEHQRWLQGFGTRLAGYVVLFVLLGVFLERLVTRRLERLKVTSDALAEGNYAARPPDGDITGADEIGALARAFVRMGEAIESQDASLRESEARYRNVSENMRDALIVIQGEAGRVVHWNPAAVQLFGYSQAEAMGQSVQDLIAPAEEAAEMTHALREFQRHGQGPLIGRTSELLARHRAGHLLHIELSVSAMQLAAGWQAVAVARDISARKARERDDFYARRAAETKFAFTAALLQSGKPFAERVQDALAVFSHWPDFINIDGGVRLVLNQDENGVCDTQVGAARWQGLERPAISSGRLQVVSQCTRTQPPHGHYFLQLYLGDEHLGVLILDTPVAPSEHPACIEALEHIGEGLSMAIGNERARQMTEVAVHQSAAASKAKSEFLATMSHEIRTPLNGILGMAQLLLMHGTTDQERNEFARIILNSGNTLLTLLNDILDISKIEAGKLELSESVYSPMQLVLEVMTLFSELAHEKGLEIRQDMAEGLGGNYIGDPVRIRQVLSNLVNNAIKFTFEGKVTLRLDTVGEGAEEKLRFSVQDTGIGISSEAQARLFLPFSQVDGSNTRVHGGTGLGLSIVRSLAELMGGEAGVTSTLGQGACFWFTVRSRRAREGTERRQGARLAVNLPPEGEIGGSPPVAPRILLVDDNATNLRVAQALLEKRGYRVLCAVNGEEAVALACVERERPDLVLMDCQMPVLDGLEATRRIRAWESAGQQRHLPIVALTAGAFDADRERCLSAGMDDFLAKPFNVNVLQGILDRWLMR